MNKKTYLFAILLLLAFSATLNAWQQDPHLHSHKSTGTPEWAELMGSMDKMHATMASSEVETMQLWLKGHEPNSQK
ncbi:MAG TPA: hypothetical protein VN872_01760 [Candidatus Acidoferrum sp.]|nr:hypothetical protein [Candidatus Acidoferrum sp.]